MSDLSTFRGRLAERRSRARLLEVGAPGVSRRWRPLRPARRLVRVVAFAVAAACSLAGLALALQRAATSVTVTPDTYTIGGAVLHARAPGHYTGDGALVIRDQGSGVIASAADAQVGGTAESGVCFLSQGQRQERCAFVIGGGTVSAVDTWTGSGWQRRYDDGVIVSLPASTMAPVPFAVGR